MTDKTLTPRYNQMGSAMVACYNAFDGAPSGAWVAAKDYDTLETELTAATAALEAAQNRVAMLEAITTGAEHKAIDKALANQMGEKK